VGGEQRPRESTPCEPGRTDGLHNDKQAESCTQQDGRGAHGIDRSRSTQADHNTNAAQGTKIALKSPQRSLSSTKGSRTSTLTQNPGLFDEMTSAKSQLASSSPTTGHQSPRSDATRSDPVRFKQFANICDWAVS
jgi:hypothetical protein